MSPALALAKLEDKVQKALRKVGIVVHIERERRECNIDSSKASVREILLRQPCQFATWVLDEFMCSNGLTVGQSTKLGILIASGYSGIVHKLRIKLRATFHKRLVLIGCQSELLLN